MREARAVVAGVLCAVLVIIAIGMQDGNMPAENATVGVLAFVGVVALLVGADVFKAYHDFKHDKDDEEPD